MEDLAVFTALNHSGSFGKNLVKFKKDKYVIHQLRVGLYGEKLWPRSQFFTIRTSQPANNMHIYKQTCVILFIICIPWACLYWQESLDKRPRMKNGERFVIHSSTHLIGAEGEWRVSSWLAISNTREKLSWFYTCVVATFLRAGNPCKTLQFMW